MQRRVNSYSFHICQCNYIHK